MALEIKKPMCKCLKLANKELAKSNARIPAVLSMNFKKGNARMEMFIPLEKVNPKIKKKLPTMVVTFCPICGERQVEDK